MNDIGPFIPLLLIVVVFWLLIVRPARRRTKEVAALQASIEPGREIMTAGGIYGTVTSIDDEIVSLEVSPGVNIRIHRQAIGRLVDPVVAGDGSPETEG